MTTKRKHLTLSLMDKVEILQKLDNGSSIANLATFYNVGRATIYDVRKNRTKIEEFSHTMEADVACRKTMKKGKFEEMEKALYGWFLQEQRRTTPITTDALKQKAKFFTLKIYNIEQFQASDGWLTNFKKRYGIRLSTVSDEKISCHQEVIEPVVELSVENFPIKVEEPEEEPNLTPEQMQMPDANVGGPFWHGLPHNSDVCQGKKGTPGKRKSNESANSMICSKALERNIYIGLDLIGQTMKNECNDADIVYEINAEKICKITITSEEALEGINKTITWAKENGTDKKTMLVLKKLQQNIKSKVFNNIK